MHIRTPEIGIDLGTSYTMMYVKKRGTVVTEPSLVVVEGSNRRQIVAVGEGYKAKKSCLNGIASIKKNAPEAPIEDQTQE